MQTPQRQGEDARVGLAIAKIARDDDGIEILLNADHAHFGHGPDRLGVGQDGQPIARPQFFQYLAHFRIKLQAIERNAPVQLGQEMRQLGQLGLGQTYPRALQPRLQKFPPHSHGVELRKRLAAGPTLGL